MHKERLAPVIFDPVIVVPAFLSFQEPQIKYLVDAMSSTFGIVKKVLSSSENYSTGQLEFANKFVKTFKEMNLPSCMAPIQILLDEL